MSFRLLVILAYVGFILFHITFVFKLFRNIKILFPKLKLKIVNIVLWVLSVLFYLYPINRLSINTAGIGLSEGLLYNYLILYPFWMLGIIVLQSMILLLIIDVVRLPLIFFLKQKRQLIRRAYAIIVLGIALLSAIYVPIRITIDEKDVEQTSIQLGKNNLPSELENFRIAFISDIQADRFTNDERLGNFIDKLNSLDPDLVLIAGDLITGSPDYISYSAEMLGKIKSNYGVYSCVGDHDNWSYRRDVKRSRKELKLALAQNGVILGDNENDIVHIGSSKLALTFVTYTYSDRISTSELSSLTNKNDSADVKIYLTHQPKEFLIDDAKDNGYDLFLAGHTHGGQISIWTPFGFLSPTLLETNRVRGEFWKDNLLIVVCRGLGYSLAPVRYNSTPEIIMIELKKTNS